MDYYFDIKIIPDEEVPIYFIRNKIYSKFHKILFTMKANNIGISFPNYRKILGNILRIHSNQDNLTQLKSTNWLGGLSGYCEISEIQIVPDKTGHRTISRKQANMTEAKLRRLIKRGSISNKEIKNYKIKMFQQGFDNPYLEIDSISNGHKHRRYIQFGKLTEQAIKGEFDQFGLSKTATVPWF